MTRDEIRMLYMMVAVRELGMAGLANDEESFNYQLFQIQAKVLAAVLDRLTEKTP